MDFNHILAHTQCGIYFQIQIILFGSFIVETSLIFIDVYNWKKIVLLISSKISGIKKC